MSDHAYPDALKRAVRRNIEKIGASAVFVDFFHPSMADFERDPIPAIQLAIAVLLDKPIVLAVLPGRREELPEHLVRVADEILEGTPEEIPAKLAAYLAERETHGNDR